MAVVVNVAGDDDEELEAARLERSLALFVRRAGFKSR
jgi:hypothetical protein